MGVNDEWQRYCQLWFHMWCEKGDFLTGSSVHPGPITNCNWVVAPTGSKRECCWTLSLWAIRAIFQFLSRLSLERRSKCKMINIPSEATEPQRVCPHLHSRPNRIQELLQWPSMLVPTSLPHPTSVAFSCLLYASQPGYLWCDISSIDASHSHCAFITST